MVSPRISHPILSRLAHVQKNDDLRTSSWSFCSFILALFNFSLETSAVVGPEFTGNPCGEKKPWATNPQKIKDSVWKLSQEHVVLTWCVNGFIYGMRQRKPLFLASNIKWTMQKRQFSGLMKSLKLEWTVEPPKNGKGMERRGSLSIHATGWSCKATVSDGFSPNLFGHACVFFGGETLLTEKLPNGGGAYGPTNTSRWDKRGRALHRWPAGLRLYVGHGDETLGIFMDLGVFFPWKWVIKRFTLYLCHRVGTIYNLVVAIYKNGGGYM